MAATGFTPIQLYHTTTAAAVPSSGNLVNGELAVNITDKKLYAKDNTGAVFVLASESGASGTVSSVAMTVPTFLSVSGSPITSSGTLAVSLSGTALPVENGGTGATSLTANNVLLGNGTSAVQVVAPGTSGNVLTSNGTTWQSTTPAAGVSLSADNTWTGTQTFNGTTSKEAVVLLNAAETTNIVAGTTNGNATAYFNTASVNYYTSNNSANWTQNLIFASGVSLDSVLSTGQSMTMAILSTNGGTAYYPTSIQVDGSTSGVTTKWQGGTAPSSGNASSIDVYTYTVIKTASATFTVLASQTKFA